LVTPADEKHFILAELETEGERPEIRWWRAFKNDVPRKLNSLLVQGAEFTPDPAEGCMEMRSFF
jgi:hypothetical protein